MNERSSTTRVAMKGREERMFFDSLSLRESSIFDSFFEEKNQ